VFVFAVVCGLGSVLMLDKEVRVDVKLVSRAEFAHLSGNLNFHSMHELLEVCVTLKTTGPTAHKTLHLHCRHQSVNVVWESNRRLG
jgi:hypothetical protein